jgi:hypothetical protein
MKLRVTTLPVLALALAFLTAPHAFAQTDDAWVSEMRHEGRFLPHPNSGTRACDGGTEVFVAMGSNGGGYCFEKSERTAAQFEVARETCAALGKRLPEPAEFKYACNNAGGLSDMTDDWEWASNSVIGMLSSNDSNYVESIVAGSGGCARLAIGHVGAFDGSTSSVPFRCVR